MKHPETVSGPYFPRDLATFAKLGDAVDFASLMSHDIHCDGAMELFGMYDEEEDDPFYRVACNVCGDVEFIRPVVYYRYMENWVTGPQA